MNERETDQIAADFASIRFSDHEARKLALAYFDQKRRCDRLARENERLREVADAAERAVILEYDRGRGPAENTEIEKRARRLREALKALADPGEREGQE